MDTPPRAVAGYVRAARKAKRLQSRLQIAEARLEPLRRRTAIAMEQVRARRGRLTGGQLAWADRILRGDP